MERSEKLLSRDYSVLVIVDVQDVFLKPIKVRDFIVENIQLLVQVAKQLEVPIIATTQNAEKLGALTPELAELIGDTPVVDKLCFSCLGSEPFAQQLQATGRSQIVLAGVEAHICVMQTALDMLHAGYSVHVPYDAVASRQKRDWKYALLRLSSSGAAVSTVESVIYEWLYEAGTDSFRAVLPLLKTREQARQKAEDSDEEEEDKDVETPFIQKTDSEGEEANTKASPTSETDSEE